MMQMPVGQPRLDTSSGRGPVPGWPGTESPSVYAPAGMDPRQAALSAETHRYIAQGYRVESRDAYSVVLVKGHRVNHVLHLLLTVFLLGLWLFVWIPLAIFGGEKRMMLWVDESGYVRARGV